MGIQRKPGEGSVWKILRSAALALLGVAAAVIPLRLLLRRALRDAPEEVRDQGWPIRLVQVIFAKYILQWMDVEGLENLPRGSYLVASNHAYKSGVDGFLLGHLLATRTGHVPRILMTAASRGWLAQAERWVLHHYGIALLVPDETAVRGAGRKGLSDIIASYLRESDRHLVLIFPAGRAIADPLLQLEHWSTGAVVAAAKSGRPVVPLAFGGLPPDWTAENVIFSAIESHGPRPPFQIHVRIGKPIDATGEPHADLERLRGEVAKLMRQIPNPGPPPEEG